MQVSKYLFNLSIPPLSSQQDLVNELKMNSKPYFLKVKGHPQLNPVTSQHRQNGSRLALLNLCGHLLLYLCEDLHGSFSKVSSPKTFRQIAMYIPV